MLRRQRCSSLFHALPDGHFGGWPGQASDLSHALEAGTIAPMTTDLRTGHGSGDEHAAHREPRDVLSNALEVVRAASTFAAEAAPVPDHELLQLLIDDGPAGAALEALMRDARRG